MLNKLVVGVDLHTWGKQEHNRCVFCDQEAETVNHLLLDCVYVARIWRDFADKAANRGVVLNVTVDNLILNSIHEVTTDVHNILAIVIKQFIYRCRCMGCRPIRWEAEIEDFYDRELFLSKWKGSIKKHVKKWQSFKPELNNLLYNHVDTNNL